MTTNIITYIVNLGGLTVYLGGQVRRFRRCGVGTSVMRGKPCQFSGLQILPKPQLHIWPERAYIHPRRGNSANPFDETLF